MANSQSVASRIFAKLSPRYHQTLDHIYSRLAAFNGPYFPDGWGDLSVVRFDEDVAAITAWPPPGLKVSYHLMQTHAARFHGFIIQIWDNNAYLLLCNYELVPYNYSLIGKKSRAGSRTVSPSISSRLNSSE